MMEQISVVNLSECTKKNEFEKLVSYSVASERSQGKLVLVVLGPKDFFSTMKHVFNVLKRDNRVEFYIFANDLFQDKPEGNYLIDRFPELKNITFDEASCAVIAML